MTRSKAVAPGVGDALVVTNLANTATEWRTLRPHDGNLYFVGMGMVTPYALGLALALPHRRVLALRRRWRDPVRDERSRHARPVGAEQSLRRRARQRRLCLDRQVAIGRLAVRRPGRHRGRRARLRARQPCSRSGRSKNSRPKSPPVSRARTGRPSSSPRPAPSRPSSAPRPPTARRTSTASSAISRRSKERRSSNPRPGSMASRPGPIPNSARSARTIRSAKSCSTGCARISSIS